MKIYSFYRDKFELLPIEVEVLLTPGIPKFTFIGLPDAAIKESVIRIRSALQSSGFALPKGMQVIVNLKPPYIKKSSCGLELAVAVAYLLQTKQIDFSQYDLNELYVYGELSLPGDVVVPDDFDYINLSSKKTLLTGESKKSLEINTYQISHLSELNNEITVANSEELNYKRPGSARRISSWIIDSPKISA
ncbi:hypothetical protein N9W41_00275 [bacterium]|nr:hypothetical protein [bacterium]